VELFAADGSRIDLPAGAVKLRWLDQSDVEAEIDSQSHPSRGGGPGSHAPGGKLASPLTPKP